MPYSERKLLTLCRTLGDDGAHIGMAYTLHFVTYKLCHVGAVTPSSLYPHKEALYKLLLSYDLRTYHHRYTLYILE